MKLQKVFWWNGALAVAMLLVSATPPAYAQGGPSNSPAAAAVDKPYLVEWVYKVKWGYADEFWEIFKKYQIATLNREKALGYVTSYTVYRPGLHTGEDTRWEYRVVITYKLRPAMARKSRKNFSRTGTRKSEKKIGAGRSQKLTTTCRFT